MGVNPMALLGQEGAQKDYYYYYIITLLLLPHLLADVRFTAAQYADDVEPVLPDAVSVPAFVAGMDVYGDATRQRMQPSKSKLLPLGGATTTDAGESVAGIQVVDSAKALGIIFGTRDCLGMDWDHRMGIVRARMQKISRVPNLSAFGRAFAISGYALSTLCITHSTLACYRLSMQRV
jgi:hypothetical protein